ncbi:rod shape-determining protein [Bianquea renquensis]|uniref:Cell shape-determining protein MreB n=1 Tax=Bianquea renquensis TaxID=2763661 RepID=A0A926DU99_9FIRM|nr:rod shape-determining protein MreB [Bianquea renquensis]MBC8543494.1 rod shape-determining protein MreB [Bianquea renquensis]
MLSTSIGIDLGTASVLVYIRGKGIVMREPSVVAINSNEDNQVVAVGEEARRMIGRTPSNIRAIRPLRDGVISDYQYTEKMLKYFIQRAIGRRFLKPVIAVCVPSGVTDVEKKAVMDATYQAGAREVHIIEEPIAAAIGAGIDISKPVGSMVVDIGGGTCDIAVISLGGIVVSDSIKVAGDRFDEAIVRFMRKRYNLLIGERTAEDVKIAIGSAYSFDEKRTMDVRGRNLVSGLPVNQPVTSDDIRDAMQEPISAVVEAIHGVLERTPPELAADIYERGIIMTGGGSLLTGLDRLIQDNMGLDVFVAEDAISCVAIGTGRFVEHLNGDGHFQINH